MPTWRQLGSKERQKKPTESTLQIPADLLLPRRIGLWKLPPVPNNAIELWICLWINSEMKVESSWPSHISVTGSTKQDQAFNSGAWGWGAFYTQTRKLGQGLGVGLCSASSQPIRIWLWWITCSRALLQDKWAGRSVNRLYTGKRTCFHSSS